MSSPTLATPRSHSTPVRHSPRMIGRFGITHFADQNRSLNECFASASAAHWLVRRVGGCIIYASPFVTNHSRIRRISSYARSPAGTMVTTWLGCLTAAARYPSGSVWYGTADSAGRRQPSGLKGLMTPGPPVPGSSLDQNNDHLRAHRRRAGRAQAQADGHNQVRGSRGSSRSSPSLPHAADNKRMRSEYRPIGLVSGLPGQSPDRRAVA